jgi:hypothetical protein
MLERMPARALDEWMRYYEVEPWGEECADFRAGMIASTIANVHRRPNTRSYGPADFMPSLRPPPEYAISEAEIERRITNFMRRYGG